MVEWRKDEWQLALIHAPVERIAEQGDLAGLGIHWIAPTPPLNYLADPFPIWRDGALHVFAEAFDYRTGHGTIDCLTLDPQFRLSDRRCVLHEPWHLSYPNVFEAEGEVWMLPEACASGSLTLYRANRFPDRWQADTRIDLSQPAIDPTLFHRNGRWWLFYTPAGTADERLSTLHLASAGALRGPWVEHPGNPIRVDRGGARPAGRVIVMTDGRMMLPVQDCRGTYGAAVRLLQIDRLDERTCILSEAAYLTAPAEAAPYRDGFHTLNGAGPVTLIDCKQRRFSLLGLSMRPRREAAQLVGRFGRALGVSRTGRSSETD